MTSSPGPSPTTLLYFAPVAWDSYPQRPHYFAEHFLNQTHGRVVWVDPYPTRWPALRDVRRLVDRTGLRRERPPGLSVLTLRALPLEPLAAGRWLNHRLLWRTLVGCVSSCPPNALVIGIGRPSSLALAALHRLRPARSFFDAMDNFPEFYRGSSRRTVAAHEREIAAHVDVVVTSSTALWEKFLAVRACRLLVRNAFDMAALPPLPIARDGRPVLGFVGCVSEWFDWRITVNLARAVPDAEVRIVGPVVAPPPRMRPSNITLFPACLLPEAIEQFRQFSVGIIPFRRTPLTEAVDPVKYYGARGMGLPVLTTRFGEMTRRGIDDGAFFMDRGGDFEEARTALRARFDDGAIERFRRDHSWERRFEESGLWQSVLPS